jgi:ribosomal protein L11 methyltransferase
MNLRTDFPVLLTIEALEGSDVSADELLGVLADYPVVAIHELESEPRICWRVSFGETGWVAWDDPGSPPRLGGHRPMSAPLDAKWRRFPDLAELTAAAVGRRLVSELGAARVKCEMMSDPTHWSLTEFEASHGRVRVGRILVAPPWQFPDPDGTTIILKIKPSTGFGTCHHPSTRLALALLQKLDCEDREVLDVGTGSGLLAMAAARLGAARVCAIDRDPGALAAAVDGLERNALVKRVELMHADIASAAVGAFDIVLANLETEQIHAWADALLRHVRPTGHLVLSGFLAAESEVVWSALRRPARLVEYEDGWAAGVIDGLSA